VDAEMLSLSGGKALATDFAGDGANDGIFGIEEIDRASEPVLMVNSVPSNLLFKIAQLSVE
jgi:hypothetical protein